MNTRNDFVTDKLVTDSQTDRHKFGHTYCRRIVGATDHGSQGPALPPMPTQPAPCTMYSCSWLVGYIEIPRTEPATQHHLWRRLGTCTWLADLPPTQGVLGSGPAKAQRVPPWFGDTSCVCSTDRTCELRDASWREARDYTLHERPVYQPAEWCAAIQLSCNYYQCAH